jgi:HEAT repeat protein
MPVLRFLTIPLLAGFALPLFGASSTTALLTVPSISTSVIDELDDALAELIQSAEQAEIEQVKKVAEFRNRKALDGLLGVYEETPSAYIKRSILVVLPNFDNVEGCGASANELLMNEAVGNEMLELRTAALDSLIGCRKNGAAFLRMIVDSDAEDEIRVTALDAHVGMRKTDDDFWYGRIYKYGMGIVPEVQKGKKKDEEPVGPRPLDELRIVAFGALAGAMDIDELQAAAEDRLSSIRVRAVEELFNRGEKKIDQRAADIFDDQNERWQNRAAAARIMLDLDGAKFAKTAIKVGTKRTTPGVLRMEIADQLAGRKDEAIDKLILKGFGKGKDVEKLFFLRAAVHIENPKLEKSTLKMFKDKERAVVEAAVDFAIAHRYEEVEEAVQKLFDEAESEVDRALLLTSLGRFKGGAEWRSQLVGYIEAGGPEMRNSALVMLSEYGKAQLPVIVKALAHPLWSTRLVALQAIEQMRIGSAIGDVIAQMEAQTGRMKVEFGSSLFRMTGQFFGSRYQPWRAWWEKEGGADYKMLSKSKLKLKIEEREIRKLKELTGARFFGIQIESERVVFILDVSGSMSELTRGRYAGSAGEPRINLAIRELGKCLDQLSQKSFFNIVPFSSSVAAWGDGMMQWTPEVLVDAKSFVQKLGAGGGTNLFGSLEFVFEDAEVDTIFILSDGEPSVGRLQDPRAIRDEVAKWNKNRDVKIHSIAIGGNLQVLEWLAKDSGGTYVRFP